MPLSGAGSTSTPPTSSLEQEKMLLRIHHLFVATHRDIEELGYDVDNIVCRNVHVEVRRELWAVSYFTEEHLQNFSEC